MTTQINQDNIQASTLAELGSGPTVTNIQITNSSYVVLDDTAVSTSGGYIKITGTNFASGCEVIIGTTNATAVALVSSTVLNVQVPALSAGTYVVYVVNSDGSVAIRVNGLTFSGTPTWVTGSTLTSGVINVAISIQLSATGDAPLTYSLASGSSLPSGLTLTSGGLLSGTITGITVETIYNFTIDAIDAQLQESPRSFSITISVNDQYFMYNTALLSATALTLPFNNDASTNNFLVTVVGDTRPNNFGPYTPGYYSNYFDGTGDYLTVPSTSSLSMGTGDFCIEMWIYPTALSATSQVLYANFSAGTTQMGVFIRNTSTIRFSSWDTAYLDSASGSIVNNIWHHIVVCRATTTTSLFINGVRAATATGAPNDFSSSSAFSIGRNPNNTEFFPGYISNLRVIKGSALYNPSSTTITVPTTPLTAITNTSLLTCQSNRFIDNSTNAFTITRNGDTLVSGFDPFVPDTSYSTYGSGYFDGTGDYLSSAAIAAANGDFTLEGWINGNSTQPQLYPSAIYFSGVASTSFELWIQFNHTDAPNKIRFTISTTVIVPSTTQSANTWYHVAIVRSGNTVTCYINGINIGSTTYTSPLGGGAFSIGQNPSISTTAYAGYVSNVRFVNGTAVYTSAFTPPTTPLTAISNTSLLTLQTNQPNNNNAFLDSSTNNFLVTRNGNTTQGSFSPYGPLWSNYFDGNGDNLLINYNAALHLSADFTIECWFYANAFGGMILNLAGGLNIAWASYELVNQSDGINFAASSANSGYDIGSETGATGRIGTIQLGTWNHLAVTRSGNIYRGFVNGVQGYTQTLALTPYNPNARGLAIGGNYTNTWGSGTPTAVVNGYISNLRIIKGTAVYTSAFTPSTSPLTAIANTSLLTCTDNRFIDESPNNFAITRAGDVSVQRFSPFSPQTVTTFYSGYFDGTGDFLEIPANSAFDFGSGNFTIECWAYIAGNSTANSGGNRDAILFSNDDDISGAVVNGSVCLLISGNASTTGTGILFYRRQTSGAYAEEFLYTGSIAQNTWHNIAVTKNGSTVQIFLNGTQVLSQTATNTTFGTSSKVNTIADRRVTNFRNDLNGYISNMRIVKGTAVYTSNFTPPTAPLTAISGTSLLTCQSATFIDNSTNNFTITVNGNSTPRTVAPFTSSATTGVAYSPSTYGGSMYFDGTGDYLTLPTSSLFSFPGNFTIEFWIYLLTASSSSNSYYIMSLSGPTYFAMNITAGSTIDAYLNTATATFSATDVKAVQNAWNHVALVRSGSTVKIYLNGIASSSTATNSSTLGSSSVALNIANGSCPANYMSNFRIVNGTALYTSNFAPPVSPLTPIQNNVLLLNGTSAGVYDMAMMNDYETVGNSSLVTNIEKYGNSSLYFDGSGDWINIVLTTNNLFAFGSGNFTIEFWFYGISVAGGVLFDCRPLSTNGAYPAIYLSTGQLRYYVSTADRITGGSLSTSTWYHIAVSRSVTSTRMFLDGTQIGSTYTDSTTYLTANVPLIGASGFTRDGQGIINGYIDDFRVTKGVARYTANFTPLSSPFITS